MTLELAKKLKAAGFPQKGLNCNWLTDIVWKTGYDEIYAPTLSELIEACGDRFGKLERIKLGEMINWNALESQPQTIFASFPHDTPEEAVALLYLKLHE